MKFTVEEFLKKLPFPADEKWKGGVWDVEAFEKKDIKLVFFGPRGTDFQTFHEDDEFYFIARGTSDLIVDSERFSCETGDSFFVPALKPHHFENFSQDFATWAIFF